MTHHGSWWPSQVVHAGQSAGIWLISFVLLLSAWAMNPEPALWAANLVTFAAASQTEFKSIVNRTRSHAGVRIFGRANWGDYLDWAIHNVGWMLPTAIFYLIA